MPVEDVKSPPYPGEGLTVRGVWEHLFALRRWIDRYRHEHNAAVGSDAIPSVLPVPNPEKYATAQPVLSLYRHFLFLRRLREHWDHLVRIYEDDWDHPLCLRQRVVLLQAAAVLLNELPTAHEHREATGRSEAEVLRRTLDRLGAAFIVSQTEPTGHDPDTEASLS